MKNEVCHCERFFGTAFYNLSKHGKELLKKTELISLNFHVILCYRLEDGFKKKATEKATDWGTLTEEYDEQLQKTKLQIERYYICCCS